MGFGMQFEYEGVQYHFDPDEIVFVCVDQDDADIYIRGMSTPLLVERETAVHILKIISATRYLAEETEMEVIVVPPFTDDAA